MTVPHVTQFDDADVTDLEDFRQEHRAEAEARGIKLTFLPFLVKAIAEGAAASSRTSTRRSTTAART